MSTKRYIRDAHRISSFADSVEILNNVIISAFLSECEKIGGMSKTHNIIRHQQKNDALFNRVSSSIDRDISSDNDNELKKLQRKLKRQAERKAKR